jgi:hypothetical protein
MKINERRIVLLISIIFPVYIFFIFHISGPFLGKIHMGEITEKNLLSAIHYERTNATYHYLTGRFYYYSSERRDVIRALGHYKESLRLSPLQGGCWLDLAKAYQTAGRMKEAGYSIERAVSLMPQNPAVMWEAGVFYLVNGEKERAIQSFKTFLLIRPERQWDVYDLVWQIPIDSQYVLKNLLPGSYDYYKKYLLYLISTDRINEAKDLWKTMKVFNIEDEVVLKYTDYLISRRHYKDARNLWLDFAARRFHYEKKEGSSLLWNGGFEYDVLNGGFDWRVRETEGVDLFLDRDIHISGNRSLGVTFDGMHNPDIAIASQVVIVTPGSKYLLRGRIKTESLTTTNGLFLSVEGHGCKGFYKKSEVLTGTNFWREVSLEFKVPPECSAVTVKIRRERSHKLDNKISGNAWIDALSLIQG